MRHHFKSAALGLALIVAAAAPVAAQVTAPPSVQAGSYKLDSDHGKITWSVTHFGFSTYIGQFATVNATMKLDPKNLGATVLDGAVIEEGGMLAAGGLLTPGKRIGRNELWSGAPAKLWKVMDAETRAGWDRTAIHYADLGQRFRVGR